MAYLIGKSYIKLFFGYFIKKVFFLSGSNWILYRTKNLRNKHLFVTTAIWAGNGGTFSGYQKSKITDYATLLTAQEKLLLAKNM